MENKVNTIVKEQMQFPLEVFDRIQLEGSIRHKEIVNEFAQILQALKKNEIKIKSGEDEVGLDSALEKDKTDSKRGRPKKVLEDQNPKDSSDDKKFDTAASTNSDNDSISSQKSGRGKPKRLQEIDNGAESSDKSSDDIPIRSRSMRAAAQAVGEKMAKIQSFMKAKKIRRPTDFDENQSKLSSPPLKSRKTHRKQSAGSSHSQDTDDANDIDNKESDTQENGEVCKTQDVTEAIDILDSNDQSLKLKKGCYVQLEALTKSTIKSRLRTTSLEKSACKRKSSTDMFDDEVPQTDLMNDDGDAVLKSKECKKSFAENKDKKENAEKLVKSSEELHNIRNISSPISSVGSDSEAQFNGFDTQRVSVKNKKHMLKNGAAVNEVHSDSELLYIEKGEVREQIVRKTMLISKNEDNEKVVLAKVFTKKTETNILRKKQNQEKSKVFCNNDSDVEIIGGITHNEDLSEEIEHEIKEEKPQQLENHFENKPLMSKKAVNRSSDNENESPEVNIRSRTKVIKKHTEAENDDDGCRTRTKTLRKGAQHIDNSNKCLSPKPIETVLNEQNKILHTKAKSSPVPNKGELVKKRIEVFEKLKNGVENPEEDITTRVTRHAARNKAALSSEMHPSRENTRNANVVLKPSEKVRLTPLSQQMRMTPASDYKLLVVNKGLASAQRATPVENSTAFVQKQAVEEMEKKRKEDERLKRQAKEETAKKKKEKTLKATAQETRRKREEKLQKVAAAREAAEKEKHLLALKAEKEKEEKLQQIAAEKEKLKEEQAKKKQLAQQKALEHEERRKQDEAARLAKLREQEEEHKRVLAMKERELELQKQQKAAGLRLVEAEKAKYLQHGGKLGKLAAINNAVKTQQGQTPVTQPAQSYEMTPSRDERPLLEPKSENDYGIDDANSGDSSDEESKPKKKIPLWAQPKQRQELLVLNSFLPKSIWPHFMDCTANPDMNQIFAGIRIKKRTRTSSAVWNTPPHLF